MSDPRQRLQWVDSLRGLLIAHMALDHASLMMNAQRWGDELAARAPAAPTSLAQFLTRFSGVAVAPGFCFMAGFMVALTSVRREERGRARGDVTRQLLIRGLVLILADTIFGGIPRAAQGFYSFMVLSAIGASIIVVALIRGLPRAVLLALGLAIVVLHPLLDVSALPLPLRAMVYEPVRSGAFRSLYPIIPWLGVVLLGYVAGADAVTRERPRRLWMALATGSLAIFALVRLGNGFGNAYRHTGVDALDFWFFAKYPPDLAWLSFSFAQIFLAMAALHLITERGAPALLRPFALFGRVPFFFYITHFYLIAILTVLSGGSRGLAETYLLWVVVLALMLILCAWYDRKKRERPNLITRYL